MKKADEGNQDALAEARAGFIVQGTTLTDWCRSHGVDPSYAWKILKGKHVGPRSLAIRWQILTASSPAASSPEASPHG